MRRLVPIEENLENQDASLQPLDQPLDSIIQPIESRLQAISATVKAVPEHKGDVDWLTRMRRLKQIKQKLKNPNSSFQILDSRYRTQDSGLNPIESISQALPTTAKTVLKHEEDVSNLLLRYLAGK